MRLRPLAFDLRIGLVLAGVLIPAFCYAWVQAGTVAAVETSNSSLWAGATLVTMSFAYFKPPGG